MVSVIMPAYNSEAFIAEAIESVISQTYSNWQLLIIDDASSDSTHKIASSFSVKDRRIQLIKNSTNQGTYISRNKGIKRASGNFIAFLDSDDLWKPEKLEKQLEFIFKENLAACYSSYELMTEKGEMLNKKVNALPELTYQKLLKANYVGNLTGIYDTAKLGKIFCHPIKKRQDWVLWLEVIKKGGAIKSVQDSLAIYRIRKNSLSRNKLEMLKYNFEVYRKVLGYSLPISIWKMMIFLREQFFIKSRQIKPIRGGR